MAYYSAIKKDEIIPFAATWMGLESVILSEINQTEEKYHMTSLICGLLKKNDTNELTYKTETHRLREQTYGCRREGEGKLGSLGWTYTQCYI